MDSVTRMCCLALVAVGSLIAGSSAAPPKSPAALPAELQGVWTIVSCEEDGRAMKFAHNGDAGVGDMMLSEVIVQGDRWIVNDAWGRALVARAKVVATEPVTQIRVWGDRPETKKNDPYHLIYKLDGDKLTICAGKGDTPPTKFTAAKGTGQMVFVLKRAE